MDSARYQFRIDGLRQDAGQISVATLQSVLSALVQTAERATRLQATGSGAGAGKRPKWLKAAVDITVTGLTSGSTILNLEAPTLGEAAGEQFAQQELWREGPSLDDTAFDLAARAVEEAQSSGSPGQSFDKSVLDAILRFKDVAGRDAHYELIPQDGGRHGFRLDHPACDRIGERLRDLPEARAFVVSGMLDEIRHTRRCFRLLMGRRRALIGQLDATATDAEALRTLWGKKVVIEGMVHFRADGKPRLIEARRLDRAREGDAVFEEMPTAAIPESSFAQYLERQPASGDFMALWGAWPGDEPIEKLLEQLD